MRRHLSFMFMILDRAYFNPGIKRWVIFLCHPGVTKNPRTLLPITGDYWRAILSAVTFICGSTSTLEMPFLGNERLQKRMLYSTGSRGMEAVALTTSTKSSVMEIAIQSSWILPKTKLTAPLARVQENLSSFSYFCALILRNTSGFEIQYPRRFKWHFLMITGK